MEKYFAVGDEVIVFGKPVALKPRTMDHPETEVVEDGEEDFIHFNRLTPDLPAHRGPAAALAALADLADPRPSSRPQIPEPWPELHLAGVAPNWPTRAQAIRMLHFPETTGRHRIGPAAAGAG